ncbi:MAG: hypothetical protein ACRD2J_14355 [Thermoanaerobaculia bacterium]
MLVSLLALSLAAPTLLADATVEQNTKVTFGGFLGRVANLFGGKAAKEGIATTSIVSGDRRALVMGDSAEIVDLGEEKIYNLDLRRKTYTVTTFEEMRKRFEEARKDAEQSAGSEASQPQGPEWTVEVDVRDTGERETLNGWNTRHVIVTTTIHEKGKKIEEAGGAVLTGDLWLGPKVDALDELQEFEVRYARELWGDMIAGMDMQKMAMLSAMAPMFGDAMKKFQEKKETLDGTPVRSTVTFETVAAPGAQASGEEASSGGATLDPTAAAAKALGGFLKKKRQERQAETADAQPNRSALFTSTSDLLRAESAADASSLAIPGDFKLRK